MTVGTWHWRNHLVPNWLPRTKSLRYRADRELRYAFSELEPTTTHLESRFWHRLQSDVSKQLIVALGRDNVTGVAQFDLIIKHPGVKSDSARLCWPGVVANGTSGRISSEHRGNEFLLHTEGLESPHPNLRVRQITLGSRLGGRGPNQLC